MKRLFLSVRKSMADTALRFAVFAVVTFTVIACIHRLEPGGFTVLWTLLTCTIPAYLGGRQAGKRKITEALEGLRFKASVMDTPRGSKMALADSIQQVHAHGTNFYYVKGTRVVNKVDIDDGHDFPVIAGSIGVVYRDMLDGTVLVDFDHSTKLVRGYNLACSKDL